MMRAMMPHGPGSPLRSGMGQHHLPRTAFFYGAQVPVTALAQFDRVVVEADQIQDLRPLRAAGADIFAYVSVGEAEGWRARGKPCGIGCAVVPALPVREPLRFAFMGCTPYPGAA